MHASHAPGENPSSPHREVAAAHGQLLPVHSKTQYRGHDCRKKMFDIGKSLELPDSSRKSNGNL